MKSTSTKVTMEQKENQSTRSNQNQSTKRANEARNVTWLRIIGDGTKGIYHTDTVDIV
eukprot:CAMPEP_0198124734 /NCGR_PEP_ID=MMETSP1442-20131203/40734_1 /TAXON_ID= /ORGANISM="Craspedostauros australis, Strain CCMP3328" /LENGTH=57 /DNA_ID=CAMNT_0043784199 /DNA_START=566 /DNA_END=739 /DNA_ORIENTATION=-